MSRILAIANQKGGVGKTTTSVNTAAGLAQAGRRVLLVDLDPQGNATMGCGVNKATVERTVYHVLLGLGEAANVRLRVESGFDLIPANRELAGAEIELVDLPNREGRLRAALGQIGGDYDFILIDCQPSLGLLTVNALTASDGVLIPMECEYFALRGVAMLRDTIGKVKERLNSRLVIDGVLATMVDTRTHHARETVAAVVEMFGDAVFHSAISRTVKFPETTKEGVSIIESAPTSPGAIAYRNLAWELGDRLEAMLPERAFELLALRREAIIEKGGAPAKKAAAGKAKLLVLGGQCMGGTSLRWGYSDGTMRPSTM